MQPSKLRTGVLLIGLGVALLLYNMDRLDGRYFGDLLQLWPVLLIAIGIEVLARHSDIKALGYLSPLLVVCTFFYAGTRGGEGWGSLFDTFHSHDDYGRMETTERTFKVDSPVEQARYFVDLYSGRLHIGPGGEELGRGEFKSRGKVRTSISEDEGVAVVRVRQSGAAREDDAQFDMYLAKELPLTLDLKADDAEVDLEGQDLSVQTLFLELASGAAKLTLGKALDSVWTHLSVGSAKLDVRLPEGSGIRLEGQKLPDEEQARSWNLTKAGEGFESPGYKSAPVRFIFDIEKPLSDLTFETY